MVNKTVVRESRDGKVILDFETFKSDLMFQIEQCSWIVEDYFEYLDGASDIRLTREQYNMMRFNDYLKTLNEGYCVKIMGDTYYC